MAKALSILLFYFMACTAIHDPESLLGPVQQLNFMCATFNSILVN